MIAAFCHFMALPARLMVMGSLLFILCAWSLHQIASGHSDLNEYSGKEVWLQGLVERQLKTTNPDCIRLVVAVNRMLRPQAKEQRDKVLLTVWRVPGRGMAPHTVHNRDITVGDLLQFRGALKQPRTNGYPWDFDEGGYLNRLGVSCTVTAVGPACKIVGSDQRRDLLSWLEKELTTARSTMLTFHKRLLGEERGGLLASMVLGDRAVQLPEQTLTDFRDVGLSHVLAASGFNLTVVTLVAYWIVRIFIRSLWAVNLFCFTAMITFVMLAGLTPSVERAAIMCSVYLLGRCLLRSVYMPATIAFALAVSLAHDPASISDVGLQLSYAATMGIAFGAGPITELFTRFKMHTLLAESVAVVLAAQASVIPLQLLYFWNLGLLFLPANLLVAPLIPIITIPAFASSMLCLIDAEPMRVCAAMLDIFASFPLDVLLWLVKQLASLHAVLTVAPPSLMFICFYYMSLIWLIYAASTKKWLGLSLLTYIISSSVLFMQKPIHTLMLLHLGQGAVIFDSSREAVAVGKDTIGAKRAMQYFSLARKTSEWKNFTVTTSGATILVKHVPSGLDLVLVPYQNDLQVSNQSTPRVLVVFRKLEPGKPKSCPAACSFDEKLPAEMTVVAMENMKSKVARITGNAHYVPLGRSGLFTVAQEKVEDVPPVRLR